MQEIPYSVLMSQLDIQNVRELEDLLISECYYTGLLKGKLDQKQRCLHVHEVIARDVRPEAIPALVEGLGSWYILLLPHFLLLPYVETASCSMSQ